MREELKTKNEIKEDSDDTIKIDPTATDNLIGFFALLLKIDKRVNPHLYKSPKEENND